MTKARRSPRRSWESEDADGLAIMEFEIVFITLRRDGALDAGCRIGNTAEADGSVNGPCKCPTTPSVKEE